MHLRCHLHLLSHLYPNPCHLSRLLQSSPLPRLCMLNHHPLRCLPRLTMEVITCLKVLLKVTTLPQLMVNIHRKGRHRVMGIRCPLLPPCLLHLRELTLLNVD